MYEPPDSLLAIQALALASEPVAVEVYVLVDEVVVELAALLVELVLAYEA